MDLAAVAPVNLNFPENLGIGGGDAMPQAYGYEGARYTERRGQIWFPAPADSRAELTSFDRRELMRKARWMHANIGLIRRIVRAMSDMVG